MPIFGQMREPIWDDQSRAQFRLALSHALEPQPELVDRDTRLSRFDLLDARFEILRESIDQLGSKDDTSSPMYLKYLHLQIQAHDVNQILPALKLGLSNPSEQHLDMVHALGVAARRVSQRESYLTQDQRLQVAEVAMACNRFAAIHAFDKLNEMTDNVFQKTALLTSSGERMHQIIDSYDEWSDALDELMNVYASSRTYAQGNIPRLEAIDEALANLEKLRIFQRETAAAFLAPHLDGGEFEANMLLILKDVEKINTQPENNPGATMDFRALQKMRDDYETNCTRTSVSTVHRLGGANVRAGAVASDESRDGSKIFSMEKFAKIYGRQPVTGWISPDGQGYDLNSCQDVLSMLERKFEQNGTTTALVKWKYKDMDFGHVTVATIIDGRAVIVESQDRSIISVNDKGELVRHHVDPQDPKSLISATNFDLKAHEFSAVLVPETPDIGGKLCSHRAKCEQASEIMAQSWVSKFGPAPEHSLSDR